MSPYHLRHPESTPSQPCTLCGCEPHRIYVGENMFPKLTEWEWVRASCTDGRSLPGLCQECVEAQQEIEAHQKNWKKQDGHEESILPF